MPLTIKGTYTIDGYELAGNSFGVLNPVTVTGSIDAGMASHPAALYAQGPGNWSISNLGTITGDATDGIEAAAGGMVLNGPSGFVSGNYGIVLNSGGGVTNLSGGQISGRQTGVAVLGPGTVANDGTIGGTSKDGVYLASGMVTNQSQASIGGTFGVVIKGGGNLSNAGRVTGGAGTNQSGVYLDNGTVTNQAGGYLSGGWGLYVRGTGTVTNAGTIVGTSQGASFLGGGTLNNQGTMTGVWGVAIQGGIGAVSNSGVLDGTSQSGVYLSGGLVTNAFDGVIEGASGVVIRNGSGTIVNAGKIAATSGSGYSVYLAPGFSGLVSDQPGAVFKGLVSGGNAVGGTVVSTLELDAASLQGTLSGLGTNFIDFGSVLIDPGAVWTLTGANTLAAGTTMANQGVLLLNAASLQAEGTETIDGSAGIVASATVTGGAAWSGISALVDGDAGSGSILIDNQGTMAVATAVLGLISGGSGGIDVAGSGSGFSTTSSLTVGQAGSGQLTVENQATALVGGGTDIGDAPGGSGDITVTGAGSGVTNIGQLIVGDSGLGSLSIVAGGMVTNTAGAIVANSAGASGSAIALTGAGSGLAVSGLLTVGGNGSGVLRLSDGATVTAGSLDDATLAAADGQIDLSGAGTGLSVTGNATIADDGAGVLSVLSGATFAATNLTIGSLTDSSGALVVSGTASSVNVTGALNIGSALGTGDVTVGPGATIHAGVINQFGQVVDEGGLLDPTVLLDEGTDGGTGTIASDFIIDEGTIAANSKKAANGVEVVSGTVVGGGTLTISGGTTLDGTTTNSSGLLLLDNIGTLEVQGPVLNTADTTFIDNGTPTGSVTVFGTYDVANSVVDVTFLKANEVLILDDISGFAGTVTTTFGGDKFVITGGTLSNLGVSNGDTLTMSDSGQGVGGTDRIMFAGSVSAAGFNVVNGNTLQVVACFAAGTRIASADGLITVEDLRAGDQVVTAGGGCEPVVWIGQRAVNCARHPKPETVWPVRVQAWAFGENVPVCDLYLSPDHAVFVNGVLIPVKLLINGTSIAQVKRAAITYFHVELPRHAVILAEGLTVESYLDIGDRTNFQGGGETIRLFPDFAARLAPDTALVWETRGAASLVMAGELLAEARAAVATNSGRGGPRSEGLTSLAR